MSTLIFVFFFLQSSLFASDLVLSENDLVTLVKEKNPLVEASRKEMASAEVKTGQLARSFIPKASLIAGQESFRYVTDDFTSQPFYGAVAEVNLFNGGRDQLSGDIAEINFRKNKSQHTVTFFGHLENARKSFWQAVYLQALIKEFNRGLKLVRKNRTQAVRRIKSGVATRSDQYEFDIKETELTQDKQRIQLQLDKQIGELKMLIGVKQSTTIKFSQDLVHNHKWRKLLEHSETDHDYLIKPSELMTEQAQMQAKLNHRNWLPKVDAYALWLQNNQRNDFDRINQQDRQQTAFGLRASWDFSDLISGSVSGKSAALIAEAKNMKLQYLKRDLERELHIEIRELELLDGMVHEAEENINRAKKLFQLITSEYRRGVKTSGDMLSATEKLLTAEKRRMAIIKDFHIAKVHIMTKLGE